MSTQAIADGSLAFGALDIGIIVLDRNRTVTVWNEWIAAASQIGEAAAVGQQLDQLFPDGSLRAVENAVTEALEAGASSILTHSLHPSLFKLRTRAGNPLLHNVSVRPIGPMGDFRCLIQITDVTSSVLREEVLRQRQNARYEAVIESAVDAILTLDDAGAVQAANSAAARQFGLAKHDLLGRPARDLFQEGDGWVEQQSSLCDGAVQAKRFEVTARDSDGTIRHLDVAVSRWLGGSRHFTTAILRDVTDRLMAQEALQHLNETLERRIAEAIQERDIIWRVSQDLFLVCGSDLICRSFNPAWGERLGYKKHDIEGVSFDSVVHPDDVPLVMERFAQLGRGDFLRDLDIRMKSKDGGYFWYSWQAMPRDSQFYCAGRDITLRKKLEEQLRQSHKMEAIGQLTGGIAHDFNNLLAVVGGSLELAETRLQQSRLEDVHRYIGAAAGATKRAASLTHRLLAFSRQQTLNPALTDATHLVDGMEDLIRRTIGPAIELEVRAPRDLWTTLVDQNQLENALLNLCINARDAMPAGGTLTIHTSNITFDEAAARANEMTPGDYISLSVRDTGTGMTKEVIEKAFEPFFTTKPLGAGTGLGLSMVYGFANQSGGQVKVSSELGIGTTITLYLPRHERSPLQEAEEATTVSPGNLQSGGRKSVLVVDDEVLLRMVMTDALEELDYRVLEAGTGAAALNLLQSDAEIDLLITDIGLPGGMDGRQLAEAARTLIPDVKIIFVTGYTEDKTLGTGRGTRVEVITKPFAIEDLLELVHVLTA